MKSCVKWVGSLSPELTKLVEDKAQGNPLMIKEVCARVVGVGGRGWPCLPRNVGGWAGQVMVTLAGKGRLVTADTAAESDSAATPRGSSASRCRQHPGTPSRAL